MKRERQIGLAVGGSVLGHLILVGGATAMLALQRASPPGNDKFGKATKVRAGWDVTAYGDSTYATREFGEPAHAATTAGGSLWWRWTSPDQPCPVEVQVIGHDFEEVVGVYRGAVLDTLSEVTSRATEDGGVLGFVAEPNTEYHLAVAGAGAGQAGRIELRIHADPETDPEDPDEMVLLLPDLFSFEEIQPEPPENDDPPFLNTEGNEPAEMRPDSASFESDKDTRAASELPPDPEGEEGMITQDGEDLPRVLLEIAPQWESKEASAESRFIKVPEIDIRPPEQVVRETQGVSESEAFPPEQERPSTFDEVAEEPESDHIASESADALREGAANELPENNPLTAVTEREPPREASTVPGTAVGEDEPAEQRPRVVKKRTVGKLSNRGAAALDAAASPLGRYQKQIDIAVQAAWHREREAHGAFTTAGSVRLRLWINREGRVVNVKILHQDATKEMIDLSVRGIRSAVIPPIPDQVYREAKDGLVDMDYDILFY